MDRSVGVFLSLLDGRLNYAIQQVIPSIRYAVKPIAVTIKVELLTNLIEREFPISAFVVR